MKQKLILMLCLLMIVAIPAMAQTYISTVSGFGGDIVVTVEVEDGVLVDVACEGAGETAGIGSVAVERLPSAILESGTWDVEGVSGATISSSAIRQAAREALAAAGLVNDGIAPVNMKAGTYTAQANGFALCEPITVTTILSHNKIIDIKVDEVNLAETPPLLNSVIDLLIPRMLENQSVRVDSITGATMTSSAVKTAVEDCIVQALVAAECDPAAVQAFYNVPEKTGGEEELHTQVLVVGMGGSGVMTAMSAAENGAQVLAIEKNGRYGGSTGVTSEVMAINPTRIQEEYNDGNDWIDVDAMREAWLTYTEGDAKEELVDYMMYESGNAIDWLHYEHGFEFDYVPKTGFTPADVYACKYQYLPNTVGANKAYIEDYFNGIVEDFVEAGGAYMLETEAYALIMDDDGAVIGVKAEDLVDGTQYTIYADYVVLATGGFAGNGDMEEEYLSNEYFELKGEWNCFGMTTNDGKMIAAAIENGAGTYNIGMPPMVHNAGTIAFLPGYETNLVEGQVGARTGRPLVWSSGDLPLDMAISASSLAVNKHGERFTTEEQVAMLNSWIAGPRFYSVWSSTQIDALRDRGFTYPSSGPATIYLGYQGAIPAEIPISNAYEVLEDAVSRGIAYKADSIEELAALIGCEPETLKTTVETYNGYCETGVDEQFGKDAKYLDEIGEGPYYAMIGAPYCYTTCGGL
ncbi:MAG: FAD-dependent oxidoreductase, partial [Clostridia bacterium]|nr:FAD-dependent oxidoreductase [Clostridia bacterium]